VAVASTAVAASAAMVVIGRMPYPCLRVGGAISGLDDAPSRSGSRILPDARPAFGSSLGN
jgi:hypothetical protein